MKKLLIKACLASMLVALGFGTKAFALITQGDLRADIPFSFYAGNSLLPPGQYEISQASVDNPDILLLQKSDSTAAAFVNTNMAERLNPPEQVKLDFATLGDKKFLSEIWVEGTNTGYEVVNGPLKEKLAASTKNTEARKAEESNQSTSKTAGPVTPY